MKKILFLFLFFLTLNFDLRAQKMEFNFTDFTSLEYNLSDIRKVTFDGDMFNLHLFDGSIYSWNVYTIDYLDFINETSGIQNKLDIPKLNIFPNPCQDEIWLSCKSLENKSYTLLLIDLNGKILIEKNIELTQNNDFKERIDFSSFQSGNYKCVLKNDMFSISRTITKKTN